MGDRSGTHMELHAGFIVTIFLIVVCHLVFTETVLMENKLVYITCNYDAGTYRDLSISNGWSAIFL